MIIRQLWGVNGREYCTPNPKTKTHEHTQNRKEDKAERQYNAIPQQKCEMGRPISAPPFKRNVKEVNLSHETKFFTY